MTDNRRLATLLATAFSRRMLIALLMGIVSGLPLLLTGSVLQAWMKREGVDLGTIGLFALVGIPYTLKFLWAPLLDRYTPLALGRRRGWLLLFQLALAAGILMLSLLDPARQPWLLALVAVLVSFFSASQDIVIDAYRRESLSDEELGLGASLYVNGYRVGMLTASAGGLILADFIPFSWVYVLMAAAIASSILVTLFAPEPPIAAGSPQTLRDAVVTPFVEYFRREHALLILLFILLYKIGDTMAGHMTTPFYLDLGFSNSEIGAVVKLFGFWATVAGSLLGGVFILRHGIYNSLLGFGVLQALSTAGFALLAGIGYDLRALAAVVAFENFTAGMGTAAFIAFMASLTNRKFTATQYALLSSLMGVPRTILAAPTGYLAMGLGWSWFFLFCTLLAIPGLLLLPRFRSWLRPEAAAVAPKAETAPAT
ncbi:MAG TPA: AmpG family muropeptide MFS transporter [Gammaproteobacteria bacterium]|nr:AmpG family muropeptide MFS transporter [Gammaproteobacteria bacterium]